MKPLAFVRFWRRRRGQGNVVVPLARRQGELLRAWHRTGEPMIGDVAAVLGVSLLSAWLVALAVAGPWLAGIGLVVLLVAIQIDRGR